MLVLNYQDQASQTGCHQPYCCWETQLLLIPKSLQFAPDWKFYFDVTGAGFQDRGGEGEIVKSSERGGNGDWRMRGGLFHLTSFSYSSPDSMSGINQISFLDSDHFVVRLGGLHYLWECGGHFKSCRERLWLISKRQRILNLHNFRVPTALGLDHKCLSSGSLSSVTEETSLVGSYTVQTGK